VAKRTGTQIGKTKNHIGYQNQKIASIFYENQKPDAKNEKSAKNPPENPKSFGTKTDLKK